MSNADHPALFTDPRPAERPVARYVYCVGHLSGTCHNMQTFHGASPEVGGWKRIEEGGRAYWLCPDCAARERGLA